jgi:hypothetical protein
MKDRISERVEEAVADVNRELTPEALGAPPEEPPPLELAEVAPRARPEEPKEPLIDWFRVKRALGRLFKVLAISIVLALAVGAYFLLTDRGRSKPIYTFTDDQGVVHFVDDPEKIPPKYRAAAQPR